MALRMNSVMAQGNGAGSAAFRCGAIRCALRDAALDGIPDQAGDVGAVEGLDRDDAGRAGDVDFGQPFAADHVDTDEQQPAALQFRPEHGADLALALRQFGLHRRAADREVRSDFAFAGQAVDRAGDLAVDQDDALVALRHRGQERLDHMRFAPGLVEHLDQRGEVRAVAADAEDRLAAVAMQRLDDDLAMLREEGACFVEAAGDERRRHELRIVEHEHLFGRVADAVRIVHHERPIGDAFEQMRRGDIAEVERRVLPHQHDIGLLAEIEADGRVEAEMVARARCRRALYRHRMRLRPDAAVGVIQVLGEVMEQPVPARLACQHQREARIAGDVDLIERVHLDGDGEGHGHTREWVGSGWDLGGGRWNVTRSARGSGRSGRYVVAGRRGAERLSCEGDEGVSRRGAEGAEVCRATQRSA
ncbi:hypothetical protein WR25_06090 [Diploscapter pachys]|uniref:Uncharacterized protein n=1 Tax=Diploscapter pachys TaxID=2018661 RepID=A0A2A2K6G5_9BILA|nr:hypothetical protein WR25_06090 [Diploscapter pachys]